MLQGATLIYVLLVKNFFAGEKAESNRRERSPICSRAEFRRCFRHKRRSGGKGNYSQAIEYGRLQAGKESGKIALFFSITSGLL